ncbi:MAG: hypothetical protein ABR575_01175 [Actinomycetota bacterium]
MLTGTLISAIAIDEAVADIVSSVSPIDKDLDSVKLAIEVNTSAGKILEAAGPLSGQLDEVITSVGTIDETVTGILDTAGGINDTVGSINTTAKGIGSTVDGIHGNLSTVLGEVRTIKAGVAAINGRADVIIGAVRGIESDLSNVLTQVGRQHGSAGNFMIHGHANNIDCKVGGNYCNQ